MYFHMVLAIDESENIVAGYRMAATREDIHVDRVFSDHARNLLVEVIAYRQQLVGHYALRLKLLVFLALS